MDEETSALAGAIGGRVKQGRQARRWTLDDLAAAAGVSRRMLVNVEQGAVNPSVGTLLRIGEALGTGLQALVADAPGKPVRVTRAGDGATLWSSEAGGRGVLVAGVERPDALELWEWTLMPGDRHASEPHARGTAELLHVREGSVTVEVGDEVVTLAAGDAVAFPGDVAHAYVAAGERPAVFALTVLEPAVGGRRAGADG